MRVFHGFDRHKGNGHVHIDLMLALILSTVTLSACNLSTKTISNTEKVESSPSQQGSVSSSMPERLQYPPVPEQVVFAQDQLQLIEGQRHLIGYSLLPKGCASLPVIFQSEDPSVAEIDANGWITARRAGSTRITVKVSNSLSSSFEVTVAAAKIPVTGLTLNLDTITLSAGKSKQPLVTMEPDNASDKGEIWTSSDETVAVVDQSGTIRGIGAGSCIVTVASVCNPEITASVSVTVVSPSVSSAPPVVSNPSSQAPTSDSFTSWNHSCSWNMMVINKDNRIPEHYQPQICSYQSIQIDQRVLPHLKEMLEAAAADGAVLWVASGYRDLDLQTRLYNRKVNYFINQGYDKETAKTKAATIVAKPGTSEHNTGLAVDFNTVESSFCNTKGYRWLMEHAADYGFIQRYPTDKQAVTHVIYEPWHFRYVGVENAKAIQSSGLCLEEYVQNLL